MKLSENDVKVKAQKVTKSIFDYIIDNKHNNLKLIASKLNFTNQQVKIHINKLHEAGFLTILSDKNYTDNNIHEFKKYQDDELDDYMANNVMKNKYRSTSHIPQHIQDAIYRGLVSKDIIHAHSPLDDTPEKFKNNLNRVHKNMAWYGYSIYNML